ncbi:PREDICTED: uncharacterized protein LOC106818641 [Priapulus caudatus]|uniref:Uncharacterized protein LOC106818641 n=1 Tax=Priapulus caudatus TaxID=37621 RepID=A0ABM1F2Z4_PRICU|nr:PREDICTED: uncharacterized protein LOC106818641 [Priapulus caudatus]
MVNFCAIYRCGSRGDRDKKSFYRLPAVITGQCEKTLELSQKRRAKWLANVSRSIKTSNLPYVRICSDHFITGKPSTLFDCTNPDWAPTINLGHDKVTEASAARDSKRYKRTLGREEKKKSFDAASALLQLQIPYDEDEPGSTNTVHEIATEIPTQTDLKAAAIAAMQTELQRLLTENKNLKQQLSSEKMKFDLNFFNDEDDDEKVKYYTGLPDFRTLKILYQYVEPYIPHSRASVLTKFQQLSLCLVKLRLNLSHMDIGQRFGINKSSASRLFLCMIDVLHARLQPLIHWPEREQLRETMPMSFRVNFGTKVAIIIDCFEVFLERPSNLSARALTWSSYKHNNTVKFLIGITPQGSISYLSKGWGGRTSDKHVTEQCGILSQLNPGDVVLADRGFDIADSVGMMGAELCIPAFTRGKKQLSGDEVEKTRKIANVRIHVERVIGSLRQKYTILQTTLPIDLMATDDKKNTTIDKIVIVCAALTNLCPSVVPFN